MAHTHGRGRSRSPARSSTATVSSEAATAPTCTVQYSNGKIASVTTYDGKVTQGLNLVGTNFKILRSCSPAVSQSFMDYFQDPVAEPGEPNVLQVSVLAAVFYQKYYEHRSSWDDLPDDDEATWDEAVLTLLRDHQVPFRINVQWQ